MNILNLVIKEIAYRRLSFFLSLASVGIAVAVFIAVPSFLKALDANMRQAMSAKMHTIKAQIDTMEKDYRKIAENYGFNLIILSGTQDLSFFYDRGYADKFMPQDYTGKLNAANLHGFKYFIPVLEQKTRWTEKQNRTVFIHGSDTYFICDDDKTDIKHVPAAIPPGSAVIGYELWKSLNLKKGDEIRLSGRSMIIADLYPYKGSKDDITIRIDLKTAQSVLGHENQINEITALRSYGAGFDKNSIIKEITNILPDCRTIVLGNKTTAMQESINRVKQTSEDLLKVEKQNQATAKIRAHILSSVLILIVGISCCFLVVIMTVINVRQRRNELAVMHSLGYDSGCILSVFLLRAAIIGLAGAVSGIVLSLAVIAVSLNFHMNNSILLINSRIIMASLAGAPILTILSSCIPVLSAVRKNPADIFSN